LEDFIQHHLLAREGDLVRVTHREDFLRAMDARFRQPIVDFLLSGGRTGDEEPPPIETDGEPPPIPPETRPVTLSVPLGKTERGESYCWEPLGEFNPHFLIVGSPGSGKTQTAKAVVVHLRRQQVPAFVIDFENEYGDKALTGLILKPGEDVTVNPLDLLEGPPTTVKFRVSGMLKKIYGLGDQQEAMLRSAIADVYEDAGIVEKDKSTWANTPPLFDAIRDQLQALAQGKGERAKRAEAVLNRLEPIFELALFGGTTQVAFDDVLRSGATVFLRDLPTDETKLAGAEFFLRWLWHRILREGEIKNRLRLLVVLDEAHKLAYEQSPVASLLRQGRKYGVGVLLSTQQPDDFESKELAFQNTAFHMCFSCSAERHARTMAREMLGGEDLYQTIRRLRQFETVVLSHREESGPKALTVVPYFRLVSPE